MIRNIILLVIVVSFINKADLYAQQGKVDKNFNVRDDGTIGDGFDNTVRTLFLQSDEKLIVGGDFLTLNGIQLSYLTRLNTDGSIDESFQMGNGFNGKVYSVCVQPDGKIIVGGSFTAYNGVNVGRLIRLNTDGSQDTSFNTAIAAATGIIYKVGLQSDGKIIIVGSFTKYNAVTANRMARVLPNGTLDSSFNTGTGASALITNVEILPDQKIIVAGAFTVFNGAAANRMVRLHPDGRVDEHFSIGTAFNDDVNAIAIQSDGKIILGGKFTNYNGNSANRIIRINYDGTLDSGFLPSSGLSKDAVQVIKIDASGTIAVGGSFTGYYNNSEVNRLFFLNANGTIRNDFYTGAGPGSASVLALESTADRSWYIAGSFSLFDSLNQGRLTRIDSEGEQDTGYLAAGIGFDNSVLKVLPLASKETMVFGNFTRFNGAFSSRIARVLENGTLDDTFNSKQLGANNSIKMAVLQADDKIVFGGNFTKYNESTCNRIARILADGTVDPTFSLGSGFNNQVYAMAIQPDQKIIVGGNFTLYNTAQVGRIVRLLANGLLDVDFNVGLGANAIVEAVLVQPDGKILIGGRFTSFDGTMVSGLVRLHEDGSIDATFNTGSGFDKKVSAIALQSDQKIIVGGSFLMYNGTPQKRILRLNSNGSLDTTFDSGSGFSKGDVLSILVQPDDRILVGGTFSGTYKSTACLRLIRLLRWGDYDNSFQANLNNKVRTMHFTADRKLMIGGDFNSVSGESKHRVARLKICLEATDWNGIAWSNGFPSAGKEVTFSEDYPGLPATAICNCTIKEGKTVTLLSGNTLGIEFDYNGLGTLVLNNAASLYQDDDEIVNTGIVQVLRKSSPILKFDYTYWASPVADQKLVAVSPKTLSDKFFSYNYELDHWSVEDPQHTMTPGKGYCIRGPQDFSATAASAYDAIFKGVPNNGKISLGLGKENTFNLIGNPYPSALSADLFLDKNSQNIKGTLYFWTHNTPVKDHKYTSDDYAVYNLLGGVGTRAALSSGMDQTVPDGTIASNQAFFVVSKNTGSVAFDNSMRIIGHNTSFFKTTVSNKKEIRSGIEKHRIWLDFENATGIFKQILVGYVYGVPDASVDSFNSESFKGNKWADFYSILENKHLVIQGTTAVFDKSDSISLGYETAIEGEFSIKIAKKEGLFENLNVYLEDKTKGITHNLQEAPYLFTTDKGVFQERFVIHYTEKTLKKETLEKLEDGVQIIVKDKSINVVAAKTNIKSVHFFDVSGKLLFYKDKIDARSFQFSNPSCSNQLLIVKVVLENNHTITQKIVF